MPTLNLPTLPGSLDNLNCDYNQLTTLPALPPTLSYLTCSGNQLTGLPVLPSGLLKLFCNNNNISCFPAFPNSIPPNVYHNQGAGWWEIYFSIISNPFNCLPNTTGATSGGAWWWNYSSIPPVCNAGDPNNCAVTFACAVDIKYFTDYKTTTIYPNPTSDQFFIEANTPDKLTVDLFDVNGRHVFSTILNDKSKISVTTLDAGIYSMTIKTVDSVTNKKLVIVR